jgi:hypothetical protein
MDLLISVAFSCVLFAGAVLLAVKAFGKAPVLDALEMLWSGLNEVGRRVTAAFRVLIGVHIDEDDVRGALIEEIEELVSYRAHQRLTALDNKIYAAETRLTKLEKQARMVLPIAADE